MIKVEEIWAPNNVEMEKCLTAGEKTYKAKVVAVVHLHDDFYRVIYRI